MFNSLTAYNIRCIKQIGLQVLMLLKNYQLMNFLKSIQREKNQGSMLQNPIKRNGPFKIHHGQNRQKPLFVYSPTEWKKIENAKYAAFLLQNLKKLQGKQNMICWPFFKEMSKFIVTKNFRQCKTYHFRLISNLHTVDKIISYLQVKNEGFQSALANQRQNILKFYNISPPKNPNNFSQKMPLYNQVNKEIKCQLPKTRDKYFPEIPQTEKKYENESTITGFIPIAFYPIPNIKTKQQEWMECHNLFIQWANCMKELMYMQQNSK